MRIVRIVLAVTAAIVLLAAAGPASAAGPRRCRAIQHGGIYKIRVTHYKCAYADTILYSFVTLRRGHWWWTAPVGKPGFYKGLWRVHSIPGDRHAWTCTAKIPFLKVMEEEAAAGTVVCSLLHPRGRVTAKVTD